MDMVRGVFFLVVRDIGHFRRCGLLVFRVGCREIGNITRAYSNVNAGCVDICDALLAKPAGYGSRFSTANQHSRRSITHLSITSVRIWTSKFLGMVVSNELVCRGSSSRTFGCGRIWREETDRGGWLCGLRVNTPCWGVVALCAVLGEMCGL